MRRIISIILSAVILVSVFGITAFGVTSNTIDEIHVNFDARIGDPIPECDPLTSFTVTDSNGDDICFLCYRFKIADFINGFSTSAIDSISELNALSGSSTVTSPYDEQPYVFVFRYFNDEYSVDTDTTITCDNVTACGYLFSNNEDHYFYITFTPQAAGSENPDGNGNNDGTSDGEEDGENPGAPNVVPSGTKDVTATYKEAEDTETVYSVVITWGSMEFTYNEAYEGTWNPQTHDYDGKTDAHWSYADGANRITVENHSNKEITAAFKYVSLDEYRSVTGSFFKGNSEITSSIEIETAVGTAIDNPPTLTAELKLGGTLPESAADGVTCGTVTVSFS